MQSQTQFNCEFWVFFAMVVVLIFIFLFRCGPGFRPFVFWCNNRRLPVCRNNKIRIFRDELPVASKQVRFLLFRHCNPVSFCGLELFVTFRQSEFIRPNQCTPQVLELANNNFFYELHKFSQRLCLPVDGLLEHVIDGLAIVVGPVF